MRRPASSRAMRARMRSTFVMAARDRIEETSVPEREWPRAAPSRPGCRPRGFTKRPCLGGMRRHPTTSGCSCHSSHCALGAWGRRRRERNPSYEPSWTSPGDDPWSDPTRGRAGRPAMLAPALQCAQPGLGHRRGGRVLPWREQARATGEVTSQAGAAGSSALRSGRSVQIVCLGA